MQQYAQQRVDVYPYLYISMCIFAYTSADVTIRLYILHDHLLIVYP